MQTERNHPVFRASSLGNLMTSGKSKNSLSVGAKTYVEDCWLRDKKGFDLSLDNKYLTKGIESEEESITLLSIVDGKFYAKNSVRNTIGMDMDDEEIPAILTGECDIIHDDEVIDIKSAWNARTFMNVKGISKTYEWQLRAYMMLYDLSKARLAYTLVSVSEQQYAELYSKFCYYNGIVDDALPEYQRTLEQFRRNHIFDESTNYTHEERVKQFTIERDSALENYMYDKLKQGVEYYRTIKLNQI